MNFLIILLSVAVIYLLLKRDKVIVIAKEEVKPPQVEQRQLTEKELQDVKEYCRKLYEEKPRMHEFLLETYPEFKLDLEIKNQYIQLVDDLKSGRIDMIDFNLKSEALLDKIDIKDGTKSLDL